MWAISVQLTTAACCIYTVMSIWLVGRRVHTYTYRIESRAWVWMEEHSCVSSYVYEREKKEWESKWEKEAKRKKLVDFYAQSISQPVNRCHYKETTWPRDDKTHNQPSCLTVCTTRPLREGKGRGERERSITQLLITHYSLFRPISLAQTVIIDFLLLKIASTAAFPSFPTLPSLQL